MKIRRLLPVLLSASLFSSFGVALAPQAQAQPNAATAKKGARGAKGGMSKKMIAKIEEAMGKPLTADQKTRLGAASKARTAANKATTAKYAADVAGVTGLTVEQVAELSKRGMKGDAKKPAPR